MSATIIARTLASFILQVEVTHNGSMLHLEDALQQRLNEVGVVATAEGLQQFDIDGSPISLGSVNLTTKGPVEKDYQPPPTASLPSPATCSPRGGPIYCPLDRDARIVVTSPPRSPRLSPASSRSSARPGVKVYLRENHGRVVSRCLIEDVGDAVAAAALAKEEDRDGGLLAAFLPLGPGHRLVSSRESSAAIPVITQPPRGSSRPTIRTVQENRPEFPV